MPPHPSSHRNALALAELAREHAVA